MTMEAENQESGERRRIKAEEEKETADIAKAEEGESSGAADQEPPSTPTGEERESPAPTRNADRAEAQNEEGAPLLNSIHQERERLEVWPLGPTPMFPMLTERFRRDLEAQGGGEPCCRDLVGNRFDYFLLISYFVLLVLIIIVRTLF